MAYWFQLGVDGSFNNTGYSYNKDISVESFDNLVATPMQRFEKKQILGRAGYLITGGGELDNITRTASVFGAEHSASTPITILKWLRDNNCVKFSDDPTRYRKYNLHGAMQSRTAMDGLGYELDIPFDCEPFRYWVTPSTTLIDSTGAIGTMVQNAASAPNAPRIRVGRRTQGGGAGWVQFGDSEEGRVEFSNLAYPLYIDTELREVYFEDTTNGNANAITTLSKFPSWDSLEWKTISFGGNVLKLNIEMRERDY